MIDLIIWSKNRACQLDFLLESIFKQEHNPFSKISVIFTFTSKEYLDGYIKLMKKYPNIIYLQQEKKFEPNTWFLDEMTYDTVKKSSDYVCFSTDDTVLYRQIPKLELGDLPVFNNQVFSFRLGLNTVVQDCHKGTFQPVLRDFIENGTCLISWPCLYYDRNDNYGYPLALDMHVFNKSFIIDLLEKCNPWKTTNELEGKMQVYRDSVSVITSFTLSCAVNIPCNNMSGLTRSGEVFNYSTEFLNDSYLNGYTINVDWDKVMIQGCHQEVKLDLIKNG